MWGWLGTRLGKATYVAGLVVSAAGGGALFGWNRSGLVVGGALFNLMFGAIALVSVIRTLRKRSTTGATGDSAGASNVVEPDWLSLGSVEVHIAGTRKRYLAQFATVAPPVDAMNTEERRIAATLTFLGMPPATVVGLDKDYSPAGDGESREVQVVEIPAVAIRDAGRARRGVSQ